MNLADYLPDGSINPRIKEVYRGLDIISYRADPRYDNIEGFAVNLPEDGKPRVWILGPAGNDESKQEKMQTARRIIDQHLDVIPKMRESMSRMMQGEANR